MSDKYLTYTHPTTIERNGHEYPCIVEYDVCAASPEGPHSPGSDAEIGVLACKDADGVEFTMTRAEVRFYTAQIAEALKREVYAH